MLKSIIFSLSLVNVIANVADAASWSVNHSYEQHNNSNNNNSYSTQQIRKTGDTTGTVSINKDQHTYYNQNCTQHCVVYIVDTPKIQYIRK